MIELIGFGQLGFRRTTLEIGRRVNCVCVLRYLVQRTSYTLNTRVCEIEGESPRDHTRRRKSEYMST